MTEITGNNPWVPAFLGLLLGLLLGYVIAQFFERRKSGGRTVEGVQREMDEYKEEVGKHFATTSELFRDMTEKYRDVYNHLATGSQALCEDSLELARLEYANDKSLESSEEGADGAENETPNDEEPVDGDESVESAELVEADAAEPVESDKQEVSVDRDLSNETQEHSDSKHQDSPPKP